MQLTAVAVPSGFGSGPSLGFHGGLATTEQRNKNWLYTHHDYRRARVKKTTTSTDEVVSNNEHMFKTTYKEKATNE